MAVTFVAFYLFSARQPDKTAFPGKPITECSAHGLVPYACDGVCNIAIRIELVESFCALLLLPRILITGALTFRV